MQVSWISGAQRSVGFFDKVDGVLGGKGLSASTLAFQDYRHIPYSQHPALL